MIRLSGCLLVLLSLSPASAIAEITVRPVAAVEGGVVRLGDLFDGVGERGEIAVAAAPPPGGKTVYDAAWLAALAREQHLAWEPRSRYEQVAVERMSQAIDSKAIAARLLDVLGERETEVQLDNPRLRLVVGTDQATTIAVSALNLDQRSGRFSVLLSAPANDPNAEHVRVAGRLIRRTEMPVPTRLIEPGETISDRDFRMVAIRNDRLSESYIAKTSELVGKTPRRTLRPQQPVRALDVEVPVVIHRGSLVTLVLATPNMRLTAQGKAMDDGGFGAVIRVTNTKSNRVVDAVVAGPNIATVGTMPALVTQ